MAQEHGPIDLAGEADFRLGDLEVRPSTRQVVSGGQRDAVEPRVMRVLVLLARRRGLVVSRDELISACWDGRIVGDDAINRCIVQLRKLAEKGGGFEIETVPRVGYLLSETRAAAHSTKPAIAVLPFGNLSVDADQDYFIEGMVVEIITALSRYPAFSVATASAVLARRDVAADWRQVASELGVHYLLAGSVRRSGEQVRIAVQLLDASAGTQVWTERFDAKLGDVFAVQDEIANTIAGRLLPAVETAEIDHAKARRTADLGAYDLYLRARRMLGSRTEESLLQVKALLDEAILRAPDDALILAFAARVHGQVAFGWWPARETSRPIALDLGRRALLLAPDDPVVLSYVAVSLVFAGGDLDVAAGMNGRATSLNPGWATAWLHSGWTELLAGRPERALAHLETALRLDPTTSFGGRALVIGWIGWCLLLLGRHEDAITRFKEAVALLPSGVRSHVQAGLVAALAHSGRLPEARAALADMAPDAIDRVLEGWPNARVRDLYRSGREMIEAGA